MTDSVQSTRRSTLRALAALGVGGALGGEALSQSFQPDDGPTFDRDAVRQSWSVHTDYGEQDYEYDYDAQTVVTEGVTQTNLIMVDEAQEWSPRCGIEGPGVVHRFTAAGFHEGNILPEVDVSLIGSKDCGSATLTPNYSFWASGRRSDSAEWSLDDYYDDPDETAETVRQEALDTGFDVRGFSFGVALAIGKGVVGLNPIGAVGVATAELISIWGDEHHQTYNQYADDSIHVKPEHEDPLKVTHVDFSVVLPPGASTTVEVSFEYQDTGWDDDFDRFVGEGRPRDVCGDRTFEIDVPANDPSNSVSDDATEAASIEAQSYPISADDAGTLSRDLSATTPSILDKEGDSRTHELDVRPQEFVEGEFPTAGTESQLDVTREGLYPAKYQYDFVDEADDENDVSTVMRYVAERGVQFGDRTSIPELEGPSLTVDGPSLVHPVDRPVFEGRVASPGEVQDRSWHLEVLETGVGDFQWVPVDYTKDFHANTPDTFQPDASLSEGYYRARLSAEDDYEDAETWHRFEVTDDAHYFITADIEVPDTVRVGEPATFHVQTREDVTYEDVFWSEFDANGETVEHVFESTGTKTITASVVDENGKTVSTSVDVEVHEAIEVDRDFPGSAWVGEERTYEIDLGPAEPESMEWWVQYDHQTTGRIWPDVEGTSIEYAFDEEGLHDIGVDLYFPGNGAETVRRSVTVSEAEPPEVSLTASELNPASGETVEFEAEYETAARLDGDLDWTDNVDSSGSSAVGSFESDTSEWVSVSVTDDLGNSVSDAVTLEVDAADPTIDLPDSVTVYEEESVTFSADADSPNGDIKKSVWTWENPNGYSHRPSEGETYEFESGVTGEHELTLRVTDETNADAVHTVTIDVVPAGDPTASISTSVSDSTVEMSASGSYGDVDIEDYDWVINPTIAGQGTGTTVKPSGESYEYTNTAAAYVNIELTVTDEAGNTDTTSTRVDF